MIQWTREIFDKLNNIYVQKVEINDIEVAFKEFPHPDTDVWSIRFDKKDYLGKPKIFIITKEAFSRIRQLRDRRKIISYLMDFLPFYLQEKEFNFDNIPERDTITSDDYGRLPPINV